MTDCGKLTGVSILLQTTDAGLLRMGIQGLLSTCLRRQDECTETFDLIQVAQQRNGIELLVDYYSFQQNILAGFLRTICHIRANFYVRILGGEYKTFGTYVNKLINDLKTQGISLVFYVDGSKGSSSEGLEQKIDTWTQRQKQDVEKVGEIIKVCAGSKSITDLPLDCNIRPVVLEDQMMSVLKTCGCEINQCPAGEADPVIARALSERQKAFAVFSDDSDFCVIKDCRYIPFKLFDIGNNLKLGGAMDVPVFPTKLEVKVISTEKVIAMLQLQDHRMLVEMSIAAGNDFTGPTMREYMHSRLDVRGRRSIENFAGWIRHYKKVENNTEMSREMQRNRRFCEAVNHSRDFYMLQKSSEEPPKKGYYSKLLEEGIRSAQYPCNLMGMHNNFYWYRVLVEDNSWGFPSSEAALIPLRAFIYRIVLPRHENQVYEQGLNAQGVMQRREIMAVHDGEAPALHKIVPDKIFQNLRSFHFIMSHQERGNCSPNWFDRYGRKNGFIIYLLRYFLHLNWGYNLYLTENEYLALVAMVMGRPDVEHYQSMPLCPTVRCITILNWFQNLYRHAYSMLGSLLHVKHEFPVPGEMFSGAAWTAMYMVCEDHTFRLAAQQAPTQFLYSTQQFMNDVLKEKRHIIRHIVEGFFHFE